MVMWDWCSSSSICFRIFSVLKNIVDAPLKVQKRKKMRFTPGKKLLKKMGLEDKEDAYPCQLSGGQCQREPLQEPGIKAKDPFL